MRKLARLVAPAALIALSSWSCALLSGVNDLQKVDCVGLCDGGGLEDARAGGGGDSGEPMPGEGGGGDDAAAPTGSGDTGAPDVQDSGSSTPDAGVPDAGSSDAGGQDAAQPFCASLATQPSLCADFDEGNGYATQFPLTTQPSAGHIGVDGAFFSSSPDSLFAKVDSSTSGTQAVAYVSHAFTGTSATIDYAFDVMLEQYVAGQAGVVAGILLDATKPNPHILTLFVSSTGAGIEQSFPGSDGGLVFVDAPLSPAPPAKQWTRVEITVSLAQHKVSVLVGGVAALTSTSLDGSWATSGTPTVQLGLTYVASTSSAWNARFDNVVVDLH